MTNSERYPYQPGIIKTEEENDHFLAIMEDLLSRPHLTPEEDTLLKLLVRLIEDFENQHYQLNISTPRSRILHLLEAQDLEISDLASVFDLSELVSQVINGEVRVTLKQAEMLGKLFHVDGSFFIE
ncbi:transcriptional regulator [Anabaena cylindrica UHCC 0172]|uniref:helix-turn-helix domain-containing protein n=1 Tax=Anabaena cylindrica TaxID=1165 RepID=UPI002B209B98|nr:transcriptional regulator [Anabaena cylindrica]MEA5553717.1 transcriptional regulator [Anabaena cylindrica UHCC 0172]